MKIKKNFKFDNKRQIWRILPTDTNKLVIEERDTEKQQAYINFIELSSGKILLKDFQLDEKFWVGIEAIKNDVIYFHRFIKPDLPLHIGIIAFDLNNKKTLWETDQYTFHLISENKIFCYQQKFDGRDYFSIDASTGNLVEELGENPGDLQKLKDESSASEFVNYKFPDYIMQNDSADERLNNILAMLKNNFIISGRIGFIFFKDLLLLNFHTIAENNLLNNYLYTVDLNAGKYILEEKLDSGNPNYKPESFFIKDDYLFLLFGKTRLFVYSIID